MKVYKFRSEYKYSGGCLLVAANTIVAARKIAHETHSDSYQLDEGVRVPELEANVTEPQVVIDDIFIE